MVEINLIGTENAQFMEPKRDFRDRQAGTRRRAIRLPEEYVCIAPRDAPEVFEWLKGRPADAEAAEVHLRLCFNCQEAVRNLMHVDEEFRNRAGRCLHAGSSQNRRAMSATATNSADLGDASAQQAAHDHGDPSQCMKVGGNG